MNRNLVKPAANAVVFTLDVYQIRVYDKNAGWQVIYTENDPVTAAVIYSQMAAKYTNPMDLLHYESNKAGLRVLADRVPVNGVDSEWVY